MKLINDKFKVQNIFLNFLKYFFIFLLLISLDFKIFCQSISRPPILGIAHISFKVSDINKAKKYYGKLLGLEEAFSFYNPDGSLFLVNFKINDRQYIEITPNLKSDEIDRLNHICFETTDIDQMKKYLSSKGIPVPEKLYLGKDKNLHFTISDPDSHKVEFVQILTGSNHFNSKGKFLSINRISDRMSHVGITIKDPKKADSFYKDILGFSEFWRGGVNDSSLNYINLRIPESTDYIEYMIVSDDVTPTRIHSAHHLCLMVPDLQKALEILYERYNYKEFPQPKIGRNNRLLLNLYDPDGTRIELMEPHTIK